MKPIRASVANSTAAKCGHDLPGVVAHNGGGGEQRAAYGESKNISLFDQTTVWQDRLPVKSDQRDVSTTAKCSICIVVGLIIGACAVEAQNAHVLGQVGFRDVARCISMGP